MATAAAQLATALVATGGDVDDDGKGAMGNGATEYDDDDNNDDNNDNDDDDDNVDNNRRQRR
jgi:hypothetical protein